LRILEGQAHGEDTGSYSTVIRYLVADDRTTGSVHNEPDVGFDTTDLDISFAGNKGISLFVGRLIHKGFDTDGGSFTVVGDLLMGDIDVVQICECLFGFAKRERKVDMHRQAEKNDDSM